MKPKLRVLFSLLLLFSIQREYKRNQLSFLFCVFFGMLISINPFYSHNMKLSMNIATGHLSIECGVLTYHVYI